MVIDLLERDTVNIKELVLPETKPKVVRGFDPTELMKDKDYSFLVAQMQQLKESKVVDLKDNVDKWSYLMAFLSSLKFACPGKFDQLDLPNNLNRFYITEALHVLKKNREHDIPRYASYLTLLYPNNQRVKEEVSEFIPLISQQFEQSKHEHGLLMIEDYRMLRAGAIVLANHSQPLGLDDSFYPKILSDYHNSVEMDKALDRPLIITEEAATIRILFPDKPISDYLTPEDFRSFDEKFKDVLARPEWYGERAFISPAFNLKILSAESVTLGEKGLEIKMPQAAPSFDKPQPPLPAGRKF